MSFSRVRVIGFDLDQTLYPKSPGIDRAIQGYCYDRIADRLQIDREAAGEAFRIRYDNGRGLSGSQVLVGLGFTKEEAGTIIQRALEEADISEFLTPDPWTINFLMRCRARFALDIITGSSRSTAWEKLEKLKIPRLFFRSIITDDDASKSNSDAFRLWMSGYPEYTSEDFLYVGDRKKSDIDVPASLGIRGVLVNTPPEDGVTTFVSLRAFGDALFSEKENR